MKIGTMLTYSGNIKEIEKDVVDMESAGLDIIWFAEAYSFDSVSQMGYLAAVTKTVEIGAEILPIYSRTPSLLGMTAAGLDFVSGGRFHLGIGASGPQVIEGFHGVPYTAPLGRTREIIDICRMMWRREKLVYDGKYYKLPLPAGEGTGLGKPLKLINHPVRENIPIWVASIGMKNVELTAEIANGWMPIFFIPEKANDIWGESLKAGKAKRDPALGELMISAGSLVAIGEGEEAIKVRQYARSMAALYIGGMGAVGQNFYTELATRYGYGDDAKIIQELYLSGKKAEAEAAVPEEFLEFTTICGSKGYVKERLAAYKEAGITHLQIHPVTLGDQTKPQMIEMLKDMV